MCDLSSIIAYTDYLLILSKLYILEKIFSLSKRTKEGIWWIASLIMTLSYRMLTIIRHIHFINSFIHLISKLMIFFFVLLNVSLKRFLLSWN